MRKRPRHTQYERNGLSPEETLAAVVVRGGLKAWGPRWALSLGGRWWLGIMGLEPEALYEKAMFHAGDYAEDDPARGRVTLSVEGLTGRVMEVS